MKYVVGLGNPGEKYQRTRHNIGFMIVEKVAEAVLGRDISAEDEKKSVFETLFGSWFNAGGRSNRVWQEYTNMLVSHPFEDLCLIKPMTYMNLSGQIFDYMPGATPENTLIVVDEVYLPLGRVRFRNKGSSGGHNGLKSIEKSFGSDTYDRMRVGVGSAGGDFEDETQVNGEELIDFVLGEFASGEESELETVVDNSVSAVLEWYQEGLEYVQQKYNGINLNFNE